MTVQSEEKSSEASAERRSVMARGPESLGEPRAKEILDLLLSASQQGIVEHDLVAGVAKYSQRWHLMLGLRHDAQERWQGESV